jgi:uncharacterized protein
MKNILLCSLMLLAFLSHAQPALETNAPPTINVNGYAEMEVLPDEIYLTIVLREYMENKEKVAIAKLEETMKNNLKSAGVNLDNLSVSNANGNYVRVRWNEKDVLTTKDYTLKVATAEEAGKVFQALEDTKQVKVFIARVWHSKMEELKVEVHKKAIRNAKEKATYLLVELNKKCGDPIYITETPSGKVGAIPGMDVNFGQPRYPQSSDYSGDKLGLSSSSIQFEKLKITYSLNVSFVIV